MEFARNIGKGNTSIPGSWRYWWILCCHACMEAEYVILGKVDAIKAKRQKRQAQAKASPGQPRNSSFDNRRSAVNPARGRAGRLRLRSRRRQAGGPRSSCTIVCPTSAATILQILQIRSRGPLLEFWSLGFVWDLEFGTWDLGTALRSCLCN